MIKDRQSNTIHERIYAEEAITYIKKKQEKPFFIYLAHNLPHIPLFASRLFGQKEREFMVIVIGNWLWQ